MEIISTILLKVCYDIIILELISIGIDFTWACNWHTNIYNPLRVVILATLFYLSIFVLIISKSLLTSIKSFFIEFVSV